MSQKLEEQLAGLLHDKPIAAAYLFGSHASGQEHKDSDIDIAVIPVRDSEPQNFDQVLDEIIADVSRELGMAETKVDASKLDDLPLSLRFKIHRDAKILAVKDELLARETLLKDTAMYHDNYQFMQAANKRFKDSIS